MNNFEDIQNLWQQNTPANVPSAKEVMQKIRKQHNREKLRIMGGTAILVFTFVYILYVACHYQFTYISTRIGILLILFSILAAVFINSRMISLLLHSTITTDSNKMMLENLERYQQRQVFFQTTFMSAYYLLLTAGFILYMYELTRNNLLFALVAYSLTLGWIAFAWWYIRPRTIRKQRERMNIIIRNIRNLQNEIAEPESI